MSDNGEYYEGPFDESGQYYEGPYYDNGDDGYYAAYCAGQYDGDNDDCYHGQYDDHEWTVTPEASPQEDGPFQDPHKEYEESETPESQREEFVRSDNFHYSMQAVQSVSNENAADIRELRKESDAGVRVFRSYIDELWDTIAELKDQIKDLNKCVLSLIGKKSH